MLSELISFLNPFSDVLSTVFVSILVIFTIITIIMVYKNAKDDNWEQNWSSGDFDNNHLGDLDSEYGSIHELSEAVATKSEKISGIMPSMLLIIGLLGTFLGLGIALNSASSVLATANTAGMDNAMTQLMGLMEGLGAKFKTSTYGLLCFILLNAIFQIKNYENKRLSWVMNRVKQQDNLKKAKAQEQQEQRHQRLLSAIQGIGYAIQLGNQNFVDQIQTLQEKQEQAHQEFLGNFQSIHQKQSDSFDVYVQAQSLAQKELLSALHSMGHNNALQHKQSLKSLQEIANHNEATQKAMQDFVDRSVESMSSIGASADQMAEAAGAVGSSASELNAVVQTLKAELGDVMQMIKADLGNTITNMGDSFKENMSAMSDSMSKATTGISTAVHELSVSMDKTMTEVTNIIGESMELQRNSSQHFTNISIELQESIANMNNLVESLLGGVELRLDAIAANNRKMINLDKRYNSIQDLIDKSQEANEQFIDTLKQFAVQDHQKEAAESLARVEVHLKSMTSLLEKLNNKDKDKE